MAFRLKLTESEDLNLSLSSSEAYNLEIGEITIAGHYEDYEGSYHFTPSARTQTIPVENMHTLSDIIIDPIPSNYGLITWDGSVITVS